MIDDRHRVIITRPVDSAGDTVGGFRRQGISGRLHDSLLAAKPSGEAPSCGTGARLRVRSLFGARRRSALSTVGVPRVNAGFRRTHAGHNCCRAKPGDNPAPPQVHRRPIQDHRHKDGAPVSEACERIIGTATAPANVGSMGRISRAVSAALMAVVVTAALGGCGGGTSAKEAAAALHRRWPPAPRPNSRRRCASGSRPTR